MDIGSVTAALGSIKTATDIAKFIRESDLSLEKAELKLKLADLMAALADARIEVAEIQQAVAEAESQIKDLQAQLAIRAKVKWEEPLYWLETETGRDGPFCQRCYDTEEKLVRLQGSGDGHYSCRACNCGYTTPAARAREEAAMREHQSRGPDYF